MPEMRIETVENGYVVHVTGPGWQQGMPPARRYVATSHKQLTILLKRIAVRGAMHPEEK